MNNIEFEVARSACRMNKAVANKFEKIDWEQRRYELAKAAMQALITGRPCHPSCDAVAIKSVKYADALINLLKEQP